MGQCSQGVNFSSPEIREKKKYLRLGVEMWHLKPRVWITWALPWGPTGTVCSESTQLALSPPRLSRYWSSLKGGKEQFAYFYRKLKVNTQYLLFFSNASCLCFSFPTSSLTVLKSLVSSRRRFCCEKVLSMLAYHFHPSKLFPHELLGSRDFECTSLILQQLTSKFSVADIIFTKAKTFLDSSSFCI